ncbi:metal-sulfur cluster assembly factor [Patescibacteria group bacterium]|nr:metal-sulfur cluster assembly factor [Patescibacteria group bacterium]MBU1951430.1 metal-sulfur cluster assembly factor [Patescibacteria group bacterium]
MSKKIKKEKTTKKAAEEALKEVIDPELGVNIVDLGLVYSMTVRKDTIHLKMTLTFPGCPLAGPITREAEQVLEKLPGIKKAKVMLVWDPPWTPDMVHKNIKDELGL